MQNQNLLESKKRGMKDAQLDLNHLHEIKNDVKRAEEILNNAMQRLDEE